MTQKSITHPFGRKRRLHERIIETILFLFALFSIMITVGIAVILIRESFLFFFRPKGLPRRFSYRQKLAADDRYVRFPSPVECNYHDQCDRHVVCHTPWIVCGYLPS